MRRRGGVGGDAGGMHHAVDRAGHGADLFQGARQGYGVGDVAGMQAGARAKRRQRPHCRRCPRCRRPLARGRASARPPRRRPLCHLQAEAAGAAGDHHHPRGRREGLGGRRPLAGAGQDLPTWAEACSVREGGLLPPRAGKTRTGGASCPSASRQGRHLCQRPGGQGGAGAGGSRASTSAAAAAAVAPPAAAGQPRRARRSRARQAREEAAERGKQRRGCVPSPLSRQAVQHHIRTPGPMRAQPVGEACIAGSSTTSAPSSRRVARSGRAAGGGGHARASASATCNAASPTAPRPGRGSAPRSSGGKTGACVPAHRSPAGRATAGWPAAISGGRPAGRGARASAPGAHMRGERRQGRCRTPPPPGRKGRARPCLLHHAGAFQAEGGAGRSRGAADSSGNSPCAHITFAGVRGRRPARAGATSPGPGAGRPRGAQRRPARPPRPFGHQRRCRWSAGAGGR